MEESGSWLCLQVMFSLSLLCHLECWLCSWADSTMTVAVPWIHSDLVATRGRRKVVFSCVSFKNLKNSFSEVLPVNFASCLLRSYWSGIGHAAISPVTGNNHELTLHGPPLQWRRLWESTALHKTVLCFLSMTKCYYFPLYFNPLKDYYSLYLCL